ncbi:MAG: hypothetical protein Q7U74_09335, partial [Saprospiraceae bacterium]|nr:hypothetical protein [Saprospiraceae bacterium]
SFSPPLNPTYTLHAGDVVGFRGNGLFVKQSFSPPLNPTYMLYAGDYQIFEASSPMLAQS